ncbi:MAG TPA: hypothetical protein VKU41_01310 [Polyangiaceae bacterium]|nr:hypothetical protein [Polyangiaceae bacterium]
MAPVAGRRTAATACLLAGLVGCERPFLAKDGTLVFQQKGAHGAAVMTAGGLEFHDRADVPERVVVRDPYEPWRAPLGFIVPADGRFTRTSAPTLIVTPGLELSLRPSDTRVPSWGGEVLVRIDLLAPATEGSARWGVDVALVIDGAGEGVRTLARAALDQLAARDRVAVVDSAGPRVVLPAVPACHRSLTAGAIERVTESRPAGVVDRDRAVALALGELSRKTDRRVLVLTDGGAPEPVEWAQDAKYAGASLAVVSTAGGRLDASLGQVREFVPASGDPAFGGVVLAFDATPAPSHVLEASGGDARWQLEGGELALGDLRAGEARTEVIRVTVPAWTAGEAFALHVNARFADVARGGEARTVGADLQSVYDDDIERLAQSRNGDVIAYASALATVAHLDAAFLGDSSLHGEDVRGIARLHARSLALLARDMHDPAAAEEAALLEALLAR